MEKSSYGAVVLRIKQCLESSAKTSFTLKEVDDLYRGSVFEPVPYRDCGASSLQDLLEKRCDFLTVMKADAGTEVQVLLNPPRYLESVEKTPVRKDGLFEEVHNELAPSYVRKLKTFISTVGQGGLTFSEFEEAHNKENNEPLDYKGFTREKFYRGLSDVFEVRKESGVLKLYPVKGMTSIETQPILKGAGSRPKPVVQLPGPFQNVLKIKIQQCMAESNGEGVTFDKFRAFFDVSSPKPFHTHGLSEEEFFASLPHIFRLERNGGTVKLFAVAEGKTGLARQNAAGKSMSTSSLGDVGSLPMAALSVNNTKKGKGKAEGGSAGKNKTEKKQPNPAGNDTKKAKPAKAAAANANVAGADGKNQQAVSTEMKMLCGCRPLWIITCGNQKFVPTGCIAKLAGRTVDTVIDELNKVHLKPSFFKLLEDEATKVVLIRNGVADATVKMVPLKSCAAILRVLMGSQTDETLISDVSECN